MKSNIFTMYLKNKKTNWLVVTLNKDRIDTDIRNIILWTLLFIVIIFLFMFINAVKFTDHVTKPLESLINKMELFANNNSIEKLTIKENYPMFQRIAKSFNKMQETIIEKQNRIKQEIKENKEKEKILFEQSKMAAMGEMIGNIAHQWRQPLSTISTTASGVLVEKEYDILTDEKLTLHMETILESTEFLTQTIDDFRNFFKKDKEKKEFFLDNIINKNLTLLKGALKSNHIIVDNSVDHISFIGYENEMIQAILNILNNAKDALANKTQTKKVIKISSIVEQDCINIMIQDNAGGIPQTIINRIFEPYFTTKHQSQGTGIGLYMTREIVVNHMHGNILVTNDTFLYEEEEYIGAIFTISLPKDKS